MKTIAIAVVCAVAALAGAGFAWQRNEALEAVRLELAIASSQLQKTKGDLRSTSGELQALRKEFAEQKMAAEQLRSELNAAKAFLETEKAAALRLREELAKVREAGRGRAALPVPARVAPAQPAAVRAGAAGTAASAATRAQ